jgi:mRNA-degrading endonuclease RelE of RelBE toxin-antitoxin system
MIRKTSKFEKDYRELPQDIQQKVERQIRMLDENLYHPSLHTKRIQGTMDIWEARVDRQYRFTFQIKPDLLILRRVGGHGIIETEAH